MQTILYDQKNESIGEIKLPDRIFRVKWNPDLVHQALLAQLANQRQNLAHTKGRSEVRGGGRKPWKQKGTGRARHGSIRSPIWRGGGVTFGPTNERVFAKKINKKMRRLAIFSVLSKKFSEGEIKFIDNLELENHKTKNLAAWLKNFLASAKGTLLLIPETQNKNIRLAGRNLQKIGILNPESLNVYDLLKYKNILLDQKAVAVIEKHYQ